jgi:hypothetical protein
MVVFVDFWIFIFEALVVQVDRCGCVLQADEPRNLNLTINLLYFRRIEQLSFCAGTHGSNTGDGKTLTCIRKRSFYEYLCLE